MFEIYSDIFDARAQGQVETIKCPGHETYLGYVVSQNDFSPDPGKVTAVS